MAKSDSFFIRKTLDCNNATGTANAFQEVGIDLGAYVDALGKSVLRIHNVQVTYSDNTGRSSILGGGDVGVAQWQITTQTQADIIRDDDKSLVSSGRVHMFNNIQPPTSSLATEVSDVNGVNLQEWTNGYLVGVEQMYLGGAASAGFAGDVYITVVLECTVETLNQSAAMALALSQQ
jgi:hypothetical protein